MRVFVINLARSVERRRKMQSQFERLSLPFEFINAVDGRGLSNSEIAAVYSKWRARLCHGRGLSRGEIGCTLSHIKFWRRVVAENSSGFVFEDDVQLGPDVKCALNEVEVFLAHTKDPCLVQLPGLDRDIPCIGKECQEDKFIKVTSAMGAYAYGVNPAGAALLVKTFSPIKFPIDHYRHLIKHYGVNFYVYNRQVISVDMVSESTVGVERFKTYNGISWVCYKLWRLVGMLIDGLIRAVEK